MYQQQILDLFDSQLLNWKLAEDNYEALSKVLTGKIAFDGFEVQIQFNPARIRSTCATANPGHEKSHSGCFLCKENLPKEQEGIPFGDDFTVLCNPYPVFSKHLTIACNRHVPQSVIGNMPVMLKLAKALPGFVVFYNGPECGASAPMHLHFQAGPKQAFPLYNDFNMLKNRFGTVLESDVNKQFLEIKDGLRIFGVLESDNLDILSGYFNSKYIEAGKEPNLNILLWYESTRWTVCIFKRKQHRPSQYYAQGDAQILISPGAVEMAGMFVTPRLVDFEKIDKNDLRDICEQVNCEQ